MGRAAELFALVNCELSVAAHDRAHFNGAIFPFALCVLDLHHGRECPMLTLLDFPDDRVVIALFFSHVYIAMSQIAGAAADDADALILFPWIELLPEYCVASLF